MDHLDEVGKLLDLERDETFVASEFSSTNSYPYKTLDEVYQFCLLRKQGRTPFGREFTNDLVRATSYVRQIEGTSRKQSFNRCSVPKTLVCHDYKGGYLSDRYLDGRPDCKDYIFTEWWATDIFVYFSHQFVTVPPICWINAGHRHGVPVLGTLITEGNDGAANWNKILDSEITMEWFAEALALIASSHAFDGYLLNVENSLHQDQVPKLLKFIRHLRKSLPKSSYLIWYDSVIETGRLQWQNQLNDRNRAFFDACDGIYINYAYTSADLLISSVNAADRKHDVFVGVDIFGRGCPGRGFVSSIAMEMARRYDLSAAIFAPGWTEEGIPGRATLNDRILWSSMSKYLYYHGIGATEISTRFTLGVSKRGWNLQSQDLRVVLPSVLGSDDEYSLAQLTADMEHPGKKGDILETFYASLPAPPISVQPSGTTAQSDCLHVTLSPQFTPSQLPLLLLEIEFTRSIILTVEWRHHRTSSATPSFFFVVEDSKHRAVTMETPPTDNVVTYVGTSGAGIVGQSVKSTYRLHQQGKLLEFGLVTKEKLSIFIDSLHLSVH